MSRRYYLGKLKSNLTALGTVQQPKCGSYRVSWAAPEVALDPTGVFVNSWVLCLVNADDHSALLADVELLALPDISLDATLGSVLTTSQLNTFKTNLTSWGIDNSQITAAMTLRACLLFLQRQIEPGFLIETLWVG